MRLLVVIVNYRTADLTIDCLKSLRNEIATIPDARVVVTDNASPDDSAERLSQWVGSCNWHEPVTFIPLERNCGFAAGNNAAIRPAIYSGDPPHYVLLLNPDTIVRPGGVRALVDFMDKHPAAGVAGSRLEHLDAQPQRSAFRFPTPLSELEEGTRIGCLTRLLSRRVVAPPPPSDACAVDWVAGASMMVRKEVFEKIGLLDEGYFMYYEEVDFCLRARRAGFGCWYVPQSRVVHLVGQSSGVTDARLLRRRRPAYWFESRRRFFLTHYGRARTFLADLMWAAGFAQWRIRRLALGQADPDPERMLSDFLRHNFLAPARQRSAQ